MSFIGDTLSGIVRGALSRKIKTVVKDKATEVMRQEDVAVEHVDVEDVATQVTDVVAPAVIAAVANSPIGVRANAEPLYKSVNLWLGVGGVLSAVGGMITAYFSGAPLETYMPLAGALITSVGMMLRRVQMQQTL